MKKVELNEDQKRAYKALTVDLVEGKTKGLTLIGEGGTGKTTCIAHAVESWTKAGMNVLLVAPTNKAVKQLEASIRSHGLSTSRVNCCTLHKALGLALLPNEEDKRTVRMGEGIIGDYDIVVCDEGSMVSRIAFFNHLLPALEDSNSLAVIMGDEMQLPPVRETESVALAHFPALHLTKVERFSSGSDIAAVTTRLRQALQQNTAFSFNKDAETVKPAHFFKEVLPLFDTPEACENVRVLAWTNRRVDEVNRKVRENLYGKGVAQYMEGERIVTGAPIYGHDNELLLSTDEECIVEAAQESSLMDDETGASYKTILLTLSPVHATVGTVFAHVIHPEAVDTLDEDLDALRKKALGGNNANYWWKRFHDLKDLFAQIKYCYAVTVHRSQGSTYKTVIVDAPDILKNGRAKERKQLLYVAMSRASERLIVSREQFTAP